MGRSPLKSHGKYAHLAVREELVSVMYDPNVLGFKGPRKMTVLLPAVDRETGMPVKCVPTSVMDTIVERGLREDREILVLHNKYPQWNEETQSYVLNFNGRVELPSVKNFQVVHDDDLEYIIVQFGRVTDNSFTLDFAYPLSPLQAFAIALTSFDAKLACE